MLAACGASATSPAAATPSVTTPSVNPTPSAVAPAAELQHLWIGAPRVVAQIGTDPVLPVLSIAGSAISLNIDLGPVVLASDAAASGPGTLSLTLRSPMYGCATGAAGTYAWSLAPGGGTLTLTASNDACAARAAAFVGTWTRSDCRNTADDCLGTLQAGTHASTFFDGRDASAAVPTDGAYGQLRYTVPAGWANSEDFPIDYDLMPAADYAGAAGVTDGSAYHGIYIFARPAAQADNASCANQLAPGVGQTPAALAAWVANRPGVIATKPTAITIGGDPGFMLDLHLAPNRTKRCPGDSFPSQGLLVDAGGATDGWNWGIGGTEQQRLILLAIGGGHTVAIFVDDNSSPSRFGELVAQAMPIITTFQFPQ